MTTSAPDTSALIGHTGFVGSNLFRLRPWADRYSRANIGSIGDRTYERVVCAAPSAVKWLANKHPERDREHVQTLIRDLSNVRCDRFVLISTVDVYPEPRGVDERTAIDAARAQPYGRHRYELEQAVRDRFDRSLIVRLPQLFGPGLKKNFVYDLIHSNALELTDHRSTLQFYDVTLLADHIDAAIASDVELINLAAEPVSCGELAREAFGIEFDNETVGGPVHYDMRSCRLESIGLAGRYAIDRSETLRRLQRFATAPVTVPPK